MLSNSSWVPNEDTKTLFSERCLFQSVFVSATIYGVTFTLYFLSLHLLVRGEKRVPFKKRCLLVVYITASFLLGTLSMVVLAALTQMAFVNNRNYPGGPSAFENDMSSVPISEVGNAAFVFSDWMLEALVVWRFKVIYQRCRIPIWIIMLFPSLALAGSAATGIMFLVQVSTRNPDVTNKVNSMLPYLSLSLALNIVLTIAIILRLLSFRYQTVSVSGMGYSTHYTSFTAMVVESAALYSAVSIPFLVLFGTKNAVSQVFLESLSQFQTMTMLLIVFRIAQGKGWTENTGECTLTTWGPEALESDGMVFAVPSTFSDETWGSGREQ